MSLHIASDLITEALHTAASHARSTFLLLDLNSKRRDQKFDASAKILDCKPVEIAQLISVTADGRLLAKSKVARAHCIDTWRDTRKSAVGLRLPAQR